MLTSKSLSPLHNSLNMLICSYSTHSVYSVCYSKMAAGLTYHVPTHALQTQVATHQAHVTVLLYVHPLASPFPPQATFPNISVDATGLLQLKRRTSLQRRRRWCMERRSLSPSQSLQRARHSPAQQGHQTRQRHKQLLKPALPLPKLRLKRRKPRPSKRKRRGNKRKLKWASVHHHAHLKCMRHSKPVK